jgi:protein NrfD
VSSILFLFLTHLGIGVAATLALVGRGAGVKFFRFMAGLAVVLLVIGLAFRPEQQAASSVWHRLALGALVAATAALTVYWATVGRMAARLRPALLATALASGAVALVAQALAVPVASEPLASLAVASFFSSALLLGSATTAMVLGHWYLVLPTMEVALLQQMVKLLVASAVVRTAVVGAVLLLALGAWQPGMGPPLERYVLSSAGVFFWQRVLFGLGGPLVLAYLTWETAKIRSTQSATGILYVDLFTVIVGEVLAKYLLLEIRMPL